MVTYNWLRRRSSRWFERTDNLECGKAVGSMRKRDPRPRLFRRPASLVAAVAVMIAGVGIGATPARAVYEPFGANLPNYDPGVHGTITHGFANCGIVLFEHINYQGKKLCGPPLLSGESLPIPLRQSEAVRFGADMDWRNKVSSVQVRPGFVLHLTGIDQYGKRQWRSYTDDTPSLMGDFNDQATEMKATTWLNVAEGNNNSADGQPVTTKNAVSCTSNQGPAKAVDTSVASIFVNKWCATSTVWYAPSQTPPTLQVDLGADRLISGVVVHHAGDGPLDTVLQVGSLTSLKVQREPDALNTRAYNIKVSSSPTGPWTLAGSYGNPLGADVTNHEPLAANGSFFRARYVQLEVTEPSFIDFATRIQEFEVLTLNR